MQNKDSVTGANPSRLLAAIRRNDAASLEKLYKDNYPKAEAYVLANNGTADEAKDVYQDAFIAVWRNLHLDRFEGDDSALAGYLYRIVKNKWLDHLRSGQYKNKVPLPQQIENSTQGSDDLNIDERDYVQAVVDNFEKLGDNCRDLLKRFYYRREPLRLIATAFGWTEATTKNNKYRCLQKLRELVKK